MSEDRVEIPMALITLFEPHLLKVQMINANYSSLRCLAYTKLEYMNPEYSSLDLALKIP